MTAADRVGAPSAATTRGAFERLTSDLPAGGPHAPAVEVAAPAQQSSCFGDVRGRAQRLHERIAKRLLGSPDCT